MASIQKLQRKSGTVYRVQIRQKGSRAISKVFDSHQAAKEWAKVMEGSRKNLDAYPDAEARRRTVAEVIDQFMLDYSGKDTAIVGRLGWWRDEYGAVSLAQFTTAKIKEALRVIARQKGRRAAGKGKTVALGSNRGPATVNRYLGAISIVMAWAVEEDWIVENPALGIRRRPEPAGRVRWLSDDERKALLKACDQSEWEGLGLLVRLALSTGARQGELLKLRWSDLDLKRGLARLGDTKTGEPRMLPLIGAVRETLTSRPRPIDSGLIFRSPVNSQRRMHFRPHWEAAVKTAKLENFRFHDIRHTTASYLAMQGASPLEIADVLGHKTLAMVKRYSHLATDHKQKLVERVFSDMVD